jgi:hypothetical protein
LLVMLHPQHANEMADEIDAMDAMPLDSESDNTADS